MVLIKRKTRLEELVVRYNTIQQAQFHIERLGADFSDYITEDFNYRTAVETAIILLSSMGLVQILEREHVPNFIFGAEDTVIVIGQDGLVANTLKYLREQPLIGVNPDPLRWDGVLLPFTVKDLRLIVQDVFQKRRPIKEVTLAKAQLNDGQFLYGVNDLFVGRKSHVSARYQIQLNGLVEQQSSSGIIVSTGMGSTGWLKSVLAGAAGIFRNATEIQDLSSPQHSHVGSVLQEGTGALGEKEQSNIDYRMDWNSPHLIFTVREPFPSRTTSTELIFGQINKNTPLSITSQMPENGVIFSDGVESDFLEFNSGVQATISIAEKQGRLVM
jgi:NAD kinase